VRLVQQRAVRHRRLLSFRVSEEGSFTLEASLVFPLILFCTVTLLFVGMYAYQNVFVQQIARTAAERLAFTWNNSHKDLITGNFTPSETDGLYWRLTHDSVTDLFGMLSGSGTTEVIIPSGNASGCLLYTSPSPRD